MVAQTVVVWRTLRPTDEALYIHGCDPDRQAGGELLDTGFEAAVAEPADRPFR